MRLGWMLALIISLLSGCAFIDGMHNQQDSTPTTNKSSHASLGQPHTMQNNQNNPTTQSSKMITTLTQ